MIKTNGTRLGLLAGGSALKWPIFPTSETEAGTLDYLGAVSDSEPAGGGCCGGGEGSAEVLRWSEAIAWQCQTVCGREGECGRSFGLLLLCPFDELAALSRV